MIAGLAMAAASLQASPLCPLLFLQERVLPEHSPIQWTKTAAEWAAAAVEFMGITVILLLAIYALGVALVQLLRRYDGNEIYHDARHRLARGVLLGLELLVAADIIHTVAIDLNITSVGLLALIVLIRTFLSFTIEVEMTGSWPWQRGEHEKPTV